MSSHTADAPSDPESSPPLLDRLIAWPVAAWAALWFAAILMLKIGSLFEPPVWDSAMGVFPPAIFLYENNFDIFTLLQQPNWWGGGPNVHSLSLLTWFIAGVMTLTGSPTATFVILHLSTFGLVAWSLALLTKTLARDGFETRTVLAASSFILLLPLVLVQVGYLYTESWVMALGIATWARLRDDRPGSAVALATIAIFVKLTGIAIVLPLALVLIASPRLPWARRFLYTGVLIAAIVTQRSLPGWLGAARLPRGDWDGTEKLVESFFERLGAVPDVSLLILLGAVASGFLIAYAVATQRRAFFDRSRQNAILEGGILAATMPLFFVAGTVYSVLAGTLFLPRYLTPIVPFSIVSLLLASQIAKRETMIFALLVLGCGWGAINFDGRLYPANYRSFSVVERSHAYRDFHQLQVEMIDALAKLPPSIPAFVSKEVDYMTSSPMMGYVDQPLSQTKPIYLPPVLGRGLDDYPDEFVLVLSNVGRLGKEGLRVAQEARQNPAVSIQVRDFESRGFGGALILVRQRAAREASMARAQPVPANP